MLGFGRAVVLETTVPHSARPCSAYLTRDTYRSKRAIKAIPAAGSNQLERGGVGSVSGNRSACPQAPEQFSHPPAHTAPRVLGRNFFLLG